MVRLTKAEIQTMSEALSFTFEEASEIAEIFYTEKEKGNIRLKHARLDNVHSYIKEWEDCWYRYSSYDELVQSEEDQGEADKLTLEQLEEEKGKSIFQLSSGMWVQTVF